MPQGRIVLKQICQSRKLASLKTDGARLLYTWLIPNVDVNGCFSGDPHVIKGQVFTRLRKSPKTIQSYLDNLQELGLVLLYEANGDIFLNIPDFVERQPSLKPDREAKTTIPPPTPAELLRNSGGTPPEVKLSKVKLSKEKEKHLTYVFLTKAEHKKLIQRFGGKATKKLIDSLDYYITNKKGKDPYTDHYRTLCKWAIKDNLVELTQSPETKEQEATSLKKVRKANLKEYGPWIKTTDEKTLIDFYNNNIHLRWLVKELRPEIAAEVKEKQSPE